MYNEQFIEESKIVLSDVITKRINVISKGINIIISQKKTNYS